MTPQRPLHFRFRACSRCGFTLVELSVTIVIIGVLATLLLTGLSRVRQTADSVACVSNLRQLAAAYRMYLPDHAGQPLPPYCNQNDPESEGHNGPGIWLLRPYYRSGPPYIWKNNKFMRDPVEICPSVRINKLSQNLANGPDYGFYVDTAGTARNYLTFFQKFSQTPLIWDGWDGVWTPGDTVPLRHLGAINCAFHDGHVETIKSADGRLYSKWWYSAVATSAPDPTQLKSGTPLGSTIIP